VPAPLVDQLGWAFALLAGQPNDPNWGTDVAQAAAAEMRKTAEQIWGPYVEVYTLPKHRRRKTSKAAKSTPASQQVPRCGPFYAKSVGVSMGGGQEAPKAFVNGAINTLLLAQLMATEPFRRIAGFVNSTPAPVSLPRFAR
jgi:hypothetical protein